MAVNKKLIGFDDELLERIEKYANEINESFTGAVRKLVEVGLYEVYDGTKETPQPDIEDDSNEPTIHITGLFEAVNRRLDQLEKDFSWWTADDTQSKVGNLEFNLGELEKKINVLTKISKLFKAHISDREIHMVD